MSGMEWWDTEDASGPVTPSRGGRRRHRRDGRRDVRKAARDKFQHQLATARSAALASLDNAGVMFAIVAVALLIVVLSTGALDRPRVTTTAQNPPPAAASTPTPEPATGTAVASAAGPVPATSSANAATSAPQPVTWGDPTAVATAWAQARCGVDAAHPNGPESAAPFMTPAAASAEVQLNTDPRPERVVQRDMRMWCTGLTVTVTGAAGSTLTYLSITAQRLAISTTTPAPVAESWTQIRELRQQVDGRWLVDVTVAGE